MASPSEALHHAPHHSTGAGATAKAQQHLDALRPHSMAALLPRKRQSLGLGWDRWGTWRAREGDAEAWPGPSLPPSQHR